MLPTRQFLNIGELSPSDGSTTEGYASAENTEKNIGSRTIAYACNVEGEIKNQITSEGAKGIEDQASKVSFRKARVSIRARSDFSLVRIDFNPILSFFLFLVLV